MAFEQTWADEIESDPEYQAIKQSDPALAAKLVRKFARKVARQEVKGSDPRMAAFLQEKLPPVKGAAKRGVGQAALEGAREGFDQSAAGMLFNAAAKRPQHAGPGALQSLKDAATDLAPRAIGGTGANTLPIPSLPALASQVMADPSVAHGVAGGVGSMIGQAPDIVAGGLAGAAATKGLARLGVKALPAAVAGNVAVGAATGAAVTKATGGTNSDAAKNAAAMGLAGLLPFAGKIPAGRLNPVIGRAHPAATAPVAAPPATPPWPALDPAVAARQRWADDVLLGDVTRGVMARERGGTPGTPEFVGLRAGASAAGERLGAPPRTRPAPPAETLPIEALFPRAPEDLLPPSPLARLEAQMESLPNFQRGRSPEAAVPAAPIGAPRGAASALDPPAPPPIKQAQGRSGTSLAVGQRVTGENVDGYGVRGTIAEVGDSGLIKVVGADGVGAWHKARAFSLAPEEGPIGSLADTLKASDEVLAAKVAAARAEAERPIGGPSAFGRLIASEEGAARIPMPTAAEAQAAGRRVREVAGQGARQTLGAAARVGEPLRKGHESLVKGVEWAGDKTGVTLLAEGLEHARQLMKSPDWLPGNPVAGALRRTFISNYGVPPELLVMAREANRQARREVHGFRRTATDLDSAFKPNGVLSTPAQREAAAHQQARLDRQITEPGTPRSQMAEEIASESSRLSALLEEVGALSPEARAKWDGHYLPRVYRDKFPVISGLVSAAAKTLKGHKARGTEKAMSPAEFQAVRGEWEFRGYTGPGADALARAEARLEALQAERAAITPGDWRAFDAIDARIEAATARVMDAAESPGLKVRAWRDWTVEERAKMGEVRHATMRMLKLADRFEKDFATGRLLADIAKNPEWAQPIPAGADPLNPPPGFVGWKDIGAAAPGGVKKWGKLANHWIREDVAHYLRTNIELQRNLTWVKTVTGTNLWKRFVTLYNPSYFVNNAMVNVPTLELAGGSVFDLPAAGRELMDQGELYQALDARGTINTGAVARDLATNLDAMYARTPDAGPPGPMEMAGFLSAGAKKMEGKLGEVSQATDDLFRLALVQRLMKPVEQGGKGMTLDEAAAMAEGAFYDPTRVTAPAAQVMEAFGAPFIKVFFYQMDTMPQLILENPAKAAVLTSYFALAYAGLNAAADLTPEQAEGRKELLPEYMRGFGNHLNLPIKDAYGNPLVVDTKNWNPMAFTDTSERTAIPSVDLPVVGKVGVPQAVVPGGPFAIGASIAKNYDDFRQRQIRDPEEDLSVQAGQLARYVKDNALPSAPFKKADRLDDAIDGRADTGGRRYDVLTAIVNVLGLKAQPLDVDLAYDKLSSRYEGKLRDIDAQIRAVERDLEANPQDAAKLEAEITRLERRYERVEEERDRSLERADKATPTAPASAGASR